MAYLPTVPDQAYMDRLRRKREVIHRLTGALEEYLAHDVEAEIEYQSRPRPECAVSIDTLMKAQQRREELAHQLDALQNGLGLLPEAWQELSRITILGPVQSQLRALDEEISEIQQALEQEAQNDAE